MGRPRRCKLSGYQLRHLKSSAISIRMYNQPSSFQIHNHFTGPNTVMRFNTYMSTDIQALNLTTLGYLFAVVHEVMAGGTVAVWTVVGVVCANTRKMGKVLANVPVLVVAMRLGLVDGDQQLWGGRNNETLETKRNGDCHSFHLLVPRRDRRLDSQSYQHSTQIYHYQLPSTRGLRGLTVNVVISPLHGLSPSTS